MAAGEKSTGKYYVMVTLANGEKRIAPDFIDSWDARRWIASMSSKAEYKNATFRIMREEEKK